MQTKLIFTILFLLLNTILFAQNSVIRVNLRMATDLASHCPFYPFENPEQACCAKEHEPFEDCIKPGLKHIYLGGFSANEPTGLITYLSGMEKLERMPDNRFEKDKQGAIQRINPEEKNIYLAFTAHDKAEGADHILKTLNENEVKASFFLTGDFLRDSAFQPSIKKIIAAGHYVGPHSDKHLLYCDWQKRDSLLVSRETFEKDLENNYLILNELGIGWQDAVWFMPPYEWYNEKIVEWSEALGIYVVNFTSGVRTNADYTTPDMENYMSSDKLIDALLRFEKEKGLNGAIILLHMGTENLRTDKLYFRLKEIIEGLKDEGYAFERLP